MSYQGQKCFGKNDLPEAKNWLQEEYGAKGEALYIAVEERVENEGAVWESEIEEWRKYLENKFEEDELEEFTFVRLELVDAVYPSTP